MVFGDDALAVERREQRDLETLDELLHGAVRAASDRAEADQRHHRLALGESISQHHRDLVDPCRIRRQALDRALDSSVIGHVVPGQVEFAGDCNVHRPRAPRECGIHRLLQDVAGLIGVIDDPAALGASREHLLRIGRIIQRRSLVERTAAHPVPVGIAGDRQYRIGIRHRHTETREQIKSPRTCRRPTHTEMISVHRIAARHERGRLLMASDDTSDLSGMLEREHHACAGFPSAAECRSDADIFQTGDKRFKDPHLILHPPPLDVLHHRNSWNKYCFPAQSNNWTERTLRKQQSRAMFC